MANLCKCREEYFQKLLQLILILNTNTIIKPIKSTCQRGRSRPLPHPRLSSAVRSKTPEAEATKDSIKTISLWHRVLRGWITAARKVDAWDLVHAAQLAELVQRVVVAVLALAVGARTNYGNTSVAKDVDMEIC